MVWNWCDIISFRDSLFRGYAEEVSFLGSFELVIFFTDVVALKRAFYVALKKVVFKDFGC